MCAQPTEVNLENPIDLIRFVVDNNPTAVRNQLSRYGQNRGGLTPCMMKELLISMYNQGYNIYPIMTSIPYNPSAGNYTTDIMSLGKWNWGAIGDFFQNVGHTIGQYVAGAAGGLGALGAQGAGAAAPKPPTTETDYTPYIIGGSVLLVLVVVILLLKK